MYLYFIINIYIYIIHSFNIFQTYLTYILAIDKIRILPWGGGTPQSFVSERNSESLSSAPPRLSDGDLSTGILVRHAPNQSHPGFLGVDYLSGAIWVSTWVDFFFKKQTFGVSGIFHRDGFGRSYRDYQDYVYKCMYMYIDIYIYIYVYTLEVKDYEHDGPQFWMMKVTKYLLKEMVFGENLLFYMVFGLPGCR